MFLHENHAPLDLVLRPPANEEDNHTSYDDFVATAQSRTRDAFDTAREHLRRAAERRKDAYDIRVKPAKFSVGQWVWCFFPRRRVGKTPKWTKYYGGPYLIIRVIPPCNYVIQKSKRAKLQVVHGDKLKLCYGGTPASWLGRDTCTGGSAELAQPARLDVFSSDTVDPATGPGNTADVSDDIISNHDAASEPEQYDETLVKQRAHEGGEVARNEHSVPSLAQSQCDDDRSVRGGSVTPPRIVRPRRSRRRPAHLADFIETCNQESFWKMTIVPVHKQSTRNHLMKL
jgi:hypothetical protein